MSIPSADHTIYSFITLCLKEQGDIAGRMEITTKQGWWWGGREGFGGEVEHHHRQRRISVTGLRLRSGDRGRMTKKDVPLHSYNHPPPPYHPHHPHPATLNAHLCIIPSLTNCGARQNFICDRFRRRSAAVTPSWRSRGGLAEGEEALSGGADCKKERGVGGACFTTKS